MLSAVLSKSGVKDTIMYAAGPVAAAFASFVLVFVVSWNFVPAVLGGVAILELVALLFVMVFTLGLDQAFVREYAAAPHKGQLFASSMRVPAVSAAVAAAVAALVLPILGIHLLEGIGAQGTWIAVAYGLAALVIRMLSITVRMGGKPQVFAGLQVAQRGATALVLVLFISVSARRDVRSAMLCYLAGAAIAAGLHLFFCRREVCFALGHRTDKAQFGGLIRYGAPAAVAAFFYALLSSADRIGLAAFTSNRNLGIYAVALSIGGIINIFTSIFGTIWAPLVYQNEGRLQDPAVLSPYLDMVTLAVFSGAGAVATASWFLPHFFPGDYAGVAYFVPSCMALPVLYILSEAFGIGIGLSRRMYFSTLASATSATLALVASLLLVRVYGTAGAAVAVLLGASCFLIMRTEFAARLWISQPRNKLYGMTVLYCVGAIGSLVGRDRLGLIFPLFWMGFAGSCVLLFRHRVGLVIALVSQAMGLKG